MKYFRSLSSVNQGIVRTIYNQGGSRGLERKQYMKATNISSLKRNGWIKETKGYLRLTKIGEQAYEDWKRTGKSLTIRKF